MTVINRSAIVPYSADEMYHLVADIESYPKFLPWCGGARIVSREENTVVAEIDIAYKKVRKNFTTRNHNKPESTIEMNLISGPFQHLHGHWAFDKLDESASKISLVLDFEFANKLVALALGPVFNKIADGLVDSFSQRAHQLHGDRY